MACLKNQSVVLCCPFTGKSTGTSLHLWNGTDFTRHSFFAPHLPSCNNPPRVCRSAHISFSNAACLRATLLICYNFIGLCVLGFVCVFNRCQAVYKNMGRYREYQINTPGLYRLVYTLYLYTTFQKTLLPTNIICTVCSIISLFV